MADEFNTFEEALKSLKNIADRFAASEDMTLDEMLKSYDSGMSAYAYCMDKLEDAQKKIRIIEAKYEH